MDSEEEQEVIVPESDSEEQCMHPGASGWKERRGWDSELVRLLGKWKVVFVVPATRDGRVGGCVMLRT